MATRKTTAAKPAPATQVLDGVPTVYRVPRSKASLAQNRFQFQLESEIDKLGDKAPVRVIPLIKYLPPSLALKVEMMTPQQAIIAIFDVYEKDVLDNFEGLDELEDVVKAWGAASGITLGE